jgi:hypothetical protein
LSGTKLHDGGSQRERKRERERERERSLWTINKRRKVGKYNALSGNTASGRSGPVCESEYYTPRVEDVDEFREDVAGDVLGGGE